jgi:hypothetical protein
MAAIKIIALTEKNSLLGLSTDQFGSCFNKRGKINPFFSLFFSPSI